MSTFWLLFTASNSHGQEIGNPFIKNMSADSYNAHAQNFAIAQDQRGILYFGNFAGILEYDGARWRIIPTENITKVSSLTCSNNGTIFAGARGEIGYLSPDPMGKMVFVSLNKMIPDGYKNFLDVIQAYSTGEGVYFITEEFIFFYDFKTISVIEAEGSILSAFYFDNMLYCWVMGKGLMKLGQGYRELIFDPAAGSGILEIKTMISLGSNRFLLGTANQGLYLLTGSNVEKFTTDYDQQLESAQITCGLLLPDQTFVFGSEQKGAIIIQPDGKFKAVIDKNAGLQNSNVSSLYLDREQNLWVALNNGLALIEIPSPISSFDERNGISGGVTGVARLNGDLYVSTFQGVFHYSSPERIFKAIPGITTGCWSVIPFDDALLAATSKGVYRVQDSRATSLSGGFTYSLCWSKTDPSRIYAGQAEGVRLLEKKNNGWTDCGLIPGITDEIVEIAEADDGTLWMNTPINGIYLYQSKEAGIIEKFDTSNGLPYMTGNHISVLSSGVHLNTRQGLYHYDAEKKLFAIYPLFPQDSTNRNIWLNLTVEDGQGNLWTTAGDEKGLSYVKRTGTGLTDWMITPFLPINDFTIWVIYPEKNGVVWFGGPDGLKRYDPAVIKSEDVPFRTLIRKVVIKDDSTIFLGTFFNKDGILSSQPPENPDVVIDYGKNSVEFDYASASYNANARNLYQYYLEGFDKIWSEWRSEDAKEYTNLPKGDYVFHILSKNVYNKTGSESTFAFRIKTPWYLLWWAYLLYILIAGIIIYLIVLIRSRQLLKEKQALEEVIHERTAEVVRQKEEIEHKSIELSDKNYELEKINNVVKSINEEIHFARLIESVLEKMTVVRGVEKALALVRDQSSQQYRFKASYGWDTAELEGIVYELEEAEDLFLKDSLEIHEDIFIKTNPGNLGSVAVFDQTGHPMSMIILVIKVEEKVEGILLLMNMTRENAFEDRDFGFIRNAKEHIISAFIKTRILEDLQHTLENLKETQKQLIQSEKLASLGQLTAGIAHEIQNPLNFVNNFSSLSVDLTAELREYIDKEKDNLPAETVENMEEVVGMLDSNVKKINEHGKRAERIVKGMLQHSRGKSGEFLPTDLNSLVEEYVNLAYHGVRAENKEFNATFVKDMDPEAGKVKLVPQDFSRVILNIMNNACYAVFEKSQKKPEGYSPTISISTKRSDQQVVIRIKDNGTGIPQAIIDKIFNPFFTTKPTGKGTGLGLSMSYDIVTNIHNGKLEVVSVEGESTEFIITIPDKS
jgi:signal transduction histidine kinase/ligand-binding sensor domain-containing protein